MIHFFRNLRKDLLDERKWSRYLLYAIGEIILVVVGILIALQINNWNERRMAHKEEVKLYRNIRQQVLDDKEELQEMKDFNALNTYWFENANQIIQNNNRIGMDTLAYYAIMLSQYSDFSGSGNIFETLVNSGDLKLIRNDEVPRKIKKLENTYNYIDKLERIHEDLIMEEVPKELRGVIQYNTLETLKPDRLYSVELQNIFFSVMYLTRGKDSIYARAIREIDDIADILDEEISSSP